MQQIDKVLKNGVTEAELEKAKNRFLTGKLLERETNNGKASALGEAAVLYGDPQSREHRPGQTSGRDRRTDKRGAQPLPHREEESDDRISARSDESRAAKPKEPKVP